MKSLRFRWRLLELGFPGLLLALGAGAFLGKVQPASAPESTALDRPLHHISLGLLAYLQSRDREALARIKSSGQEVNRFAHASATPAPADLQSLRSATLALLETENNKAEAAREWAEEQKGLQESLERLTASVRPNQLNGFAKLRSLMEATASAKSYQALAAEALWTGRDSSVALALEEQGFIRGIDSYQELAKTAHARAWVEKAQGHFKRQGRLVRQLFELERIQNGALETYIQANRPLASGALPTEAPRAWTKPRGLWILLGVSLFWILLSDRWAVRNLWKPLARLGAAVEAAAAGDVGSKAVAGSTGEIGTLAQALARLFSVVERSQNLVYHLAALVELSGEAIISQSLDGTILSWNKGAQRIYGYCADEVKGRSIRMLAPQDQGDLFQQILEQAKTGKRLRPVEMQHQAKNGRAVHAFVRAAAIFDSTKRVIGVSLCAQEIAGTRPPASSGRKGSAGWPGPIVW